MVETVFKSIFVPHVTFPLYLYSFPFKILAQKFCPSPCDIQTLTWVFSSISIPPTKGGDPTSHCSGYGYRGIWTSEATVVINLPQERGRNAESPFITTVKIISRNKVRSDFRWLFSLTDLILIVLCTLEQRLWTWEFIIQVWQGHQKSREQGSMRQGN